MELEWEIEYEKDGEAECVTVTFEAEPRWENDGIGAYEYWGAKCFDKGHDYVSLEHNGNPTWKEADYTEEENKVIKEFQNDPKKWEILCERFCEEYGEQGRDDEDYRDDD